MPYLACAKQSLASTVVTKKLHWAVQKEKAELTDLVVQQATIIEALREEAAALRRDVAFVGDRIHVNVAAENDYLESLPPLPALTGTSAEQPLEPASHMLGISPTADVHTLLTCACLSII